MSEQARQAYNAYMREWRKKNKEKLRSINQRYWEKKSLEMKMSMKK